MTVLVQLQGVTCQRLTFAAAPRAPSSRRAALHFSSAARCDSDRGFLPILSCTFFDTACAGTEKCSLVAPADVRRLLVRFRRTSLAGRDWT